MIEKIQMLESELQVKKQEIERLKLELARETNKNKDLIIFPKENEIVSYVEMSSNKCRINQYSASANNREQYLNDFNFDFFMQDAEKRLLYIKSINCAIKLVDVINKDKEYSGTLFYWITNKYYNYELRFENIYLPLNVYFYNKNDAELFKLHMEKYGLFDIFMAGINGFKNLERIYV